MRNHSKKLVAATVMTLCATFGVAAAAHGTEAAQTSQAGGRGWCC